MLMTIDVGNTTILVGVFKGEELFASFRLNSRTERTSDELGIFLLDMLATKQITKEAISDAVISSVVPKSMHALTSALQRYLQVKPIIVGPGTKTGIEVRTDNPKEVGADRITNVAACHALYKDRSCLIVDFGTATTFDYVDKNGVFKHTVIMPGLEISTRALFNATAKLPDVEIKKPESILVSNTVQGMQAGIVYGYIGAVEYIIKEMKKQLDDEPLVIATGGLGRLISKETNLIEVYNPDIAFIGMKIIYKKTKKFRKELVD